MPGILGFCGEVGEREPELLMNAMSRALKDEAWYKVESFVNNSLGLGRISLANANQELQPVWNEEKTLAVVLEGEIFDTQEIKHNLLEHGHRFQGNSDAELIIHLYAEVGENFAEKLNGAFVLAIWDGAANKLVIANDRIALHPLFYVARGEFLIFASGVRGLMADPQLPRRVDKVALAEFLTFQHVLGNRTYLEEVHSLPPASRLIFCDGKLQIRSYWTMRYAEAYQPLDEQEYIEALMYHLRKAVKRCNADNLPAGILLSGGLDSRVLLGLLKEDRPQKPLHTFTWGIPGCDDARYASHASRVAGAQHHFFELKPDYLIETAEKCIRLTDGLGNIVNLHARATLEQETHYARVLYKGFMGDALMGFGLSPKYWSQYDSHNLGQVHFRVHLDQGLILFKPDDHPILFSGDFYRQIDGAVFQAYREALDESGTCQLADQRNYFDLRQRVPHMTVQGVEVVRSRAIVRLPFCDNDLVEFVLRLPPWLRFERRLMKAAFIRAFPRLAQVPYTETGLPMIDCAQDLFLRGQRFLYWHLYRRSLRSSPHPRRRPYADYNGWFRTVLRGWVEDILLSERTLQRGIFNPNYVRNLWKEHLAGERHAARLGALLAIELWHRQFIC